jgi:hypothetical protein
MFGRLCMRFTALSGLWLYLPVANSTLQAPAWDLRRRKIFKQLSTFMESEILSSPPFNDILRQYNSADMKSFLRSEHTSVIHNLVSRDYYLPQWFSHENVCTCYLGSPSHPPNVTVRSAEHSRFVFRPAMLTPVLHGIPPTRPENAEIEPKYGSLLLHFTAFIVKNSL